MKVFARLALAATGLGLLGGCLDWQAGYNHAARNECLQNPDTRDRAACLDHVAQNSRDKAEERRQANQ